VIHTLKFHRFANWCLGLVAVSLIASSLTPVLHAQESDKMSRKLVSKAAPQYPEDLKRHDIGGTVRLEITISPKGAVDKVTPIGGNPILIDAATTAVRKWKYEPSNSYTNTEVQIEFIPSHH
jgi:TonB family protein